MSEKFPPAKGLKVPPMQPYGYLREKDGQIQISIGPERPHNRSGGSATPWFAIYTASPAPIVPDGWVMVPIEPTEDMIVYGFESEPDEDFSDPAVWEEYQAMSGCRQAARRAKLCWAAMIAAAPKLGDE